MTDTEFERLGQIRKEISKCNDITTYLKKYKTNKIAIIPDFHGDFAYNSGWNFLLNYSDKKFAKDIIKVVTAYKKRMENEFNKLVKKAGSKAIEDGTDE